MRSWRLALLSALAAVALPACGGQAGPGSGADAAPDADGAPDRPDAAPACEAPAGSTSGKLIRIIYLVPSDRVADPVRVANLEHALTDVRLWLRARMPQGTSFRAHEPLVEVVKSANPEAHFRTTASGDDPKWYFWNNVTGDAALAAHGVQGADPDNIWVIFPDADPACGQVGGAWIGSLAMGNAAHVRGVASIDQVPVCEGDSTDPGPRCQWVGRLGTLLLGALQVPFPAGCVDDDDTTECESNRLTWLGWLDYPDAVLAPEDIEYLEQSPFMRAIGLPACELSCASPVVP